MAESNRSRGFTLLEVLLALAILGASFTVLLTAHSAALRNEARARRLMTATALARQILTETEVDGIPALGGDTGDFGEEFPGYAWQRTVENVAPEDLPLPTDRLREVRIRVSWQERGREESTELLYYAVATP